MKKTLTREFAESYDLPWRDGGIIIDNSKIREGRWGTYKLCVIKIPGVEGYWGFEWFRGATEDQEDEYPWSYSDTFEVEEYVAEIKIIEKVEWIKC